MKDKLMDFGVLGKFKESTLIEMSYLSRQLPYRLVTPLVDDKIELLYKEGKFEKLRCFCVMSIKDMWNKLNEYQEFIDSVNKFKKWQNEYRLKALK